MLLLLALPVASVPTVSLLQFLPMLPPVSPGEDAQIAVSVPGSSLSAPVYLPELQTLALIDRGRQVIQNGASSLDALPGGDDVTTQSLLAGSAIATCGGAARTLAAVVLADSTGELTFAPRLAPLPLAGVEAVSSVTFINQLSAARLLIGTSDGVVSLLSDEASPVPLLSGLGPEVSAACVSADESRLYLCTGGEGAQYVTLSSLNLDEGHCSAPTPLSSLPTDAGVTGIAADVSGNLYVACKEGVLVVDETGDTMIRISTPLAATGVCFGGPSFSDLIVTAGDTAWSVKTNTQGVRPASPEFLKMMEKLTAAGDYRHVGW